MARSRAALTPWILSCVAAAGLAIVQPRLAALAARVKATTDSYELPPPEQLPVLSLGYRSAAADVLWATVLVRQGIRLSEHRRFDFASRYFDSIFALEPTYREPYLLLDAVLTFGAKRATREDVLETRRLFAAGIAARPTDAELHLRAGSFLAYIAPGYLEENEQKEFRLEGARLLQRASELGSGQSTVQWYALSAAGVLSRAGQREAAVSFLERVYAITEDEALREEILNELRGLKAESAADRAKAVAARFESTWRGELPFVSRTVMLLLGPDTRADSCVDPAVRGTAACARDWKTWTERVPSK